MVKLATQEQRDATRSRRLRKKLFVKEFREKYTKIKTTSNLLPVLLTQRFTERVIDEYMDIYIEINDQAEAIANKYKSFALSRWTNGNHLEFGIITPLDVDEVSLVKEIVALDSLNESVVYESFDAHYSEIWNKPSLIDKLQVIEI